MAQARNGGTRPDAVGYAFARWPVEKKRKIRTDLVTMW